MSGLLKSIWHVGRDLTKNIMIRDYREYCGATPRGRVLLSYLMHPLLLPARFRDRTLFSPFGIAQEIPRALNEMGYVVDIVDFQNTKWRPRAEYDLFIGHGAINFERLADRIGRKTKKVYFASGLRWKTWNLRQAERLHQLALRTGWLLPAERVISVDEDRATALVDGIIHLGNVEAGATYAEFGNVHGINNASYPVSWDGARTKDYAAGRQHFLFYQGPGNVHKGLDRLLEAFAARPALHLHVCQHIQPDFERIYKGLLSGASNIHVYQFIRQRSPLFYELARQCNWVVSATCAEGQPGSVIEMMAHGLIPILPAEANIDLGPWGISLPDCTVSTIAETCAAASELTSGVCQRRSEAVVAEVLQNYSLESFRRNFQDALRTIVNGAPIERAAKTNLTVAL